MKTKYEDLRLRDLLIEPNDKLLEEILGNSYRAYKTFCEKLGELEIQQVWQYYPCFATKAWLARGEYKWTTPRGAKKSKNIYWLSAWDKYFNLGIWFKGPNRAEVLALNLSDETKKIVSEAKQFGPKMNTFPVELVITKPEQLADVYELIKTKKRLEAKMTLSEISKLCNHKTLLGPGVTPGGAPERT